MRTHPLAIAVAFALPVAFLVYYYFVGKSDEDEPRIKSDEDEIRFYGFRLVGRNDRVNYRYIHQRLSGCLLQYHSNKNPNNMPPR